MASAEGSEKRVGDKYRSFMFDEENPIQWRDHGCPPNFDSVNQLFEQGRTKVLSLSLSVYMHLTHLGWKGFRHELTRSKSNILNIL